MRTPVVDLERLEVEQDSVGDSLFDGKYFTGIAFEMHPISGTVVAVIGYRYGKRHGAIREWDANGCPIDEKYFDVGGLHGPLRQWHSNGQLAEFEYRERFARLHAKRWDEAGKLLTENYLPATDPVWAKLEEDRQRSACPIIDIDLKTLTFFERPEGWGRNESDLPPPQPPPSLELCRALEAQTLAEH